MVRPGKAKIGTAALALTMLLSACGGGGNTGSGGSNGTAGDAGAPVSGGTLVDLQNFSGGPQDHIDPATASTLNGAQISTLLYDGLTEYDFANKENPVVKPNVAESFSANATNDVWTFKLRKGVTYSDGTPVQASDFKYAWEQVLNPDVASELTYLVDLIKG